MTGWFFFTLQPRAAISKMPSQPFAFAHPLRFFPDMTGGSSTCALEVSSCLYLWYVCDYICRYHALFEPVYTYTSIYNIIYGFHHIAIQIWVFRPDSLFQLAVLPAPLGRSSSGSQWFVQKQFRAWQHHESFLAESAIRRWTHCLGNLLTYKGE